MSSPILRGGNLVVTEQGIRDSVRQVLIPLWNSWYFFSLYANAFDGGKGYTAQWSTASTDPLDRYLLAKLRQYVEAMAGRMMKKYPFARLQNRLELGQYEAWQKETFVFNNTDVFTPDLKRFEAPSTRYKRNAYRVAEQQLALAGYRLGETMNAIFGAAAAPVSKPNP